MKSNCCGALMVEIDQDGLGICSECQEWAYDEDDSDDENEHDDDEDVEYEAAKDLEESRWKGIRATCRR
jgi:hypothetical protein